MSKIDTEWVCAECGSLRTVAVAFECDWGSPNVRLYNNDQKGIYEYLDDNYGSDNFYEDEGEEFYDSCYSCEGENVQCFEFDKCLDCDSNSITVRDI